MAHLRMSDRSRPAISLLSGLLLFCGLLVQTAEPAAAATVLVPRFGGTAGGTIQTVADTELDETDVSVDGDLVAWRQDSTSARIHSHNFATDTDQTVPRFGEASTETAPSVNDNSIAYSVDTVQGADIGYRAMVYRNFSVLSYSAEVAPDPVALGMGTLAYIGAAQRDVRAVTVGDVQLSAAPRAPGNLAVSPAGDVVVWDECPGDCNVMKVVQSTTGWSAATPVADSTSMERHPDTDGSVVVYEAVDEAAETDVRFRSLTTGIETRLDFPGRDTHPKVSRGVISFLHQDIVSGKTDLYTYMIATNTLLRITNTRDDESDTDISVLPDGLVRVVWSATDGGTSRNVYARTFSYPTDNTAPLVSSEVTGPIGDNGWYTGDVSLAWTVSEPESPSSVVTRGCVDRRLTNDQPAVEYSCAADSLGGRSGPATVKIKRDATPPTIALSGNVGTYSIAEGRGDHMYGKRCALGDRVRLLGLPQPSVRSAARSDDIHGDCHRPGRQLRGRKGDVHRGGHITKPLHPHPPTRRTTLLATRN